MVHAKLSSSVNGSPLVLWKGGDKEGYSRVKTWKDEERKNIVWGGSRDIIYPLPSKFWGA